MYMKKQFLLVLLMNIGIVCYTSSAHTMQEDTHVSNYCGLDNFLYKGISLISRNDYWYLAHTNSAWRLSKKIAFKDNIEDLDSYYDPVVIILQTPSKSFPIHIYRTPLHEAVIQGSLACITLLCASGADKGKQIKNTGIEMNETNPWFSRLWVEQEIAPEQVAGETERIKNEFCVGCSVLDLAEILIKRPGYVSAQHRKVIYEYLKKQ